MTLLGERQTRLVNQIRSVALLEPDEQSAVLDAYAWAMTAPVEDIASLAFEDVPGSSLFDPFTCPTWALGFCAIAHGTGLQPGLDEAAQRVWIDSVKGWNRGRIGSLRDAIKTTLTGEQHVTIRERFNPDSPGDAPGHITAFIRTDETPNEALTTARAEAATLYSLILHLVVGAGQPWGEAQLTDMRTWDDLQDDEPTATWQDAFDDDTEV